MRRGDELFAEWARTGLKNPDITVLTSAPGPHKHAPARPWVSVEVLSTGIEEATSMVLSDTENTDGTNVADVYLNVSDTVRVTVYALTAESGQDLMARLVRWYYTDEGRKTARLGEYSLRLMSSAFTTPVESEYEVFQDWLVEHIDHETDSIHRVDTVTLDVDIDGRN